MTCDSSILVRADAGVQMGVGHVMRCLGLAQEWQDSGGKVVYAMAASPAGVVERLQKEQVETITLTCEPGSRQDAVATVEAARSRGCDWIVLDGYHFDAKYHAAVKRSGLKLLVLDDLGALDRYVADIVLNQDPIADQRLYANRAAETRLLLGTDYAILRREFRRRPRPQRNPVAAARKLLVTMGGSDPDNVTEKVVRSLDGAAGDGLEAVVLIGPGNPHGTRLEAAAETCRTTVRLLRNPANIPELMAECDMAVSAGGSTLWELSYFAVPCIVLVIAENQRPVAECLGARRACLVVDEPAGGPLDALADAIGRFIENPDDRAACAARFSAMVDGRGAQRVVEAMQAIS